jgi:hypothetical protein
MYKEQQLRRYRKINNKKFSGSRFLPYNV